MNEELYKAPSSGFESNVDENGSTFKGILYGSLVDIFGTLTIGIVIGIIYMGMLLSQGVSESEAIKLVENMDPLSIFDIVGGLFGLLVSFYSGYLCAKKSIINVNRNTIILFSITGSLGFLMGFGHYPLLQNILFTVLSISATFSGSKYWSVNNSHKRE